MTCFPPRAAPYKVEVIKGATLIITSIHGVPHYYRVVGHQIVPPRFVITATDFNIGRTLVAAFGPSHGFLSTDNDQDICTGDLQDSQLPE
jgi:hypothetical protein